MESSHHYRRCRRYPTATAATDETPPSTSPSPFSLLPTELHLAMASHIGFYDIYALRLTCRYFARLLPPITFKRRNYSDYEELLAWNADYANFFKVPSENLAEAEASYLARSYGLAGCRNCGYLSLSWGFYCWWFGPPEERYGGVGMRSCKGCEPQVDCACGWEHHEEEMCEVGDEVAVLEEPERMRESSGERSVDGVEDGVEVGDVDVDRI